MLMACLLATIGRSSCARISLQQQLNQYHGQRVGLVSLIGHTGMMTVEKHNPFYALATFHLTKQFSSSKADFPGLNLDGEVTKILKENLKNKYPNLVIVPAIYGGAKSVRYSDSDHFLMNNRSLVNKIIQKYKLQHLIILTFGQVQEEGQDGNLIVYSDQQRFGIKCLRRPFSKAYAALRFATLRVIDSNQTLLYRDQISRAIGANSLGMHPMNEKSLCSSLLQGKMTIAQRRDFIAWVRNFYKKSVTKYLKLDSK